MTAADDARAVSRTCHPPMTRSTPERVTPR